MFGGFLYEKRALGGASNMSDREMCRMTFELFNTQGSGDSYVTEYVCIYVHIPSVS